MQLGGAVPLPFPRASVNLITCASNSGKTHLLQKIFLHPGAFIEDHNYQIFGIGTAKFCPDCQINLNDGTTYKTSDRVSQNVLEHKR